MANSIPRAFTANQVLVGAVQTLRFQFYPSDAGINYLLDDQWMTAVGLH